VLCLL